MCEKREGNVSRHDGHYLNLETHCLSNAVSVAATCNEQKKIESDRQKEETGRVGSPPWDTVCACEEEGFVQSGQLRPCDNARGGWWVSLTAAGHVDRLSYLLSAALSDRSDTAP